MLIAETSSEHTIHNASAPLGPVSSYMQKSLMIILISDLAIKMVSQTLLSDLSNDAP
jgi:hypothetical protein